MTKNSLFNLTIEEPDKEIFCKVKKEWDALAKPLDGLGDFEELICRIGSIEGRIPESISEKVLVIFCSDNGVVEEGVSQTGKEVTAKVASMMGRNLSSVGRMTAGYPLKIIPVDIGMDCDGTPEGVLSRKIRNVTGDILKEAAMSEEDCLKAIETGIDIAKMCKDKGFNIAATGEMGIGNTTTSTALYCALTHENPRDITGRGAGLPDEALEHKKQVIEQALSFHGLDNCSNPDMEDCSNSAKKEGYNSPKEGKFNISKEESCNSEKEAFNISREYAFDSLSNVGGFDLAGLTGFFIGCALYRLPVVIDGFISAVAALTSEYICPGTKDYMIASHKGREMGCMGALSHLGLKPYIDGNMALGEGTGAVMLFPILDMVFELFRNGTSFSESDIENYKRFEEDSE